MTARGSPFAPGRLRRLPGRHFSERFPGCYDDLGAVKKTFEKI